MGEAALAPWVIDAQLFYLESWPATEGLEPLSAHTEAVVDLRGRAPILPASLFAAGAQLAKGDVARALRERVAADDRVVLVGEWQAPSTAGATASLELSAWETVRDPSDWLDEHPDRGPIERRLELHAYRPPHDEAMRIGVIIEDYEPDELAGAELGGAVATRIGVAGDPDSDVFEQPPVEIRRELILLTERPGPESGPLAVVVPSPFESGEGTALVAFVEVRTAPDALDEHAGEALDFGRDPARGAGLGPSQEELERRRRIAALRALQAPATRRRALVALSQSARAPLAEEVALVATDDVLSQVVLRLAASALRAPDALDTADGLGWLVEGAAWRELATTLGQGVLAPELQALLLREAGEVGRFSILLEQLVAGSSSTEDLHRRLVDENRLFLEDSSPSSRVRAYDWLAVRDLAPAGFDPLAERDARRAALEAAASAEADLEAADPSSDTAPDEKNEERGR